MNGEHVIYIEADGRISHVYSDALAELLTGEGDARTRRASHVEPADGPYRSGWVADMRPVGGPVLMDMVETGSNVWHHGPFATRAAALAAELAWLDAAMTRGDIK